jgi:hypothetical protein
MNFVSCPIIAASSRASRRLNSRTRVDKDITPKLPFSLLSNVQRTAEFLGKVPTPVREFETTLECRTGYLGPVAI